MAWLSFTERRIDKPEDRHSEKGEYALHLQCSWRIAKNDRVLVGNQDFYYSSDEDGKPV